MGLDKEPETGFDRRFLGGRSATAHGALHQLVVHVNIGSHGEFSYV
jgi:hypothetical protein